MKQSELNDVLKLHQKWLDGEEDGVKANLYGAELHYADLYGANLINADLSGANLHGANLLGANLRNANLRDAGLTNANLQDADLYGANLTNADLRYADLTNVDLSDANLSDTDLRGADLRWVSWREAQGIKVYVVGLQSSRENAQLVYIPSFDVATTGCFQDTWENLKKRVEEVYKKDNPKIYKKYQVAIKYIEKQMELDEGERNIKTAKLLKKYQEQ